MDQARFADSEYQGKRRKTRREVFLERMDGLIPCKLLEDRIRPFYPKAGRGRHPYPLSTMLRTHCVQLFYNLSDPGMEDLLDESEPVRRFVGLRLSGPLPDETTILNFRHHCRSACNACLLMALFSRRSERRFCEQLEYNLLFKWFLDLKIMAHSLDHSVSGKNKQRLLDAKIVRGFLLEIVDQARELRLLSEEFFSMDCALLEAWASVKSCRPKDEDPPPSVGCGRDSEADFRAERRIGETRRSTTDPDRTWSATVMVASNNFANVAREPTDQHQGHRGTGSRD